LVRGVGDEDFYRTSCLALSNSLFNLTARLARAKLRRAGFSPTELAGGCESPQGGIMNDVNVTTVQEKFARILIGLERWRLSSVSDARAGWCRRATAQVCAADDQELSPT
jgi:hypothetical protein